MTSIREAFSSKWHYRRNKRQKYAENFRKAYNVKAEADIHKYKAKPLPTHGSKRRLFNRRKSKPSGKPFGGFESAK